MKLNWDTDDNNRWAALRIYGNEPNRWSHMIFVPAPKYHVYLYLYCVQEPVGIEKQ